MRFSSRGVTGVLLAEKAHAVDVVHSDVGSQSMLTVGPDSLA